jgi:hypothetical protein
MSKEMVEALRRIERKLDALIMALAEEDDEDQPLTTLDGEPVMGERNQDAPL